MNPTSEGSSAKSPRLSPHASITPPITTTVFTILNSDPTSAGIRNKGYWILLLLLWLVTDHLLEKLASSSTVLILDKLNGVDCEQSAQYMPAQVRHNPFTMGNEKMWKSLWNKARKRLSAGCFRLERFESKQTSKWGKASVNTLRTLPESSWTTNTSPAFY